MDFSQVKADAELAVTEIENLNQVVGDVIGMKFKLILHHQTSVLSSSECSVPLVDSQKLLLDLAAKIVDSASLIEVGKVEKQKLVFRRFSPLLEASRMSWTQQRSA